MKRIGTILLVILLVAVVLISSARAEDVSTQLGLEELERSGGEYAPEGTFESGFSLDQGLKKLYQAGKEQLGDLARTGVKSGVVLLVIVLFCSLAEGADPMGGKGIPVNRMVGVLAIWAVAVGDVHSLMSLGQEAMDSMSAFGTVLLPTMVTAAAAAGTPASAAAKQAAAVLFSDLLMWLISKVLIPLTYGYVSVTAVNAAVGNGGMKRLAKTLKGLITAILTTVMVAFVSYLSVSGVIAGTADALSVKTAKMAISGMVPVVGGVLSDAAETVLAGAGTLKNTVGVFGMLVILGMCLTPFLQMGVHYLVYKLSAALSGAVAEGPLVELIDQVGGAFGLMLGMTGSCGFLLLISILSCLNAAGVT